MGVFLQRHHFCELFISGQSCSATAGCESFHFPVFRNLSHLDSHVGMAIQPAQANQSLVPSLVPTSVAGSTLPTSVVPTYAMLTPSISIATAMPSTSVVADTRPTYVSLGVPLTSTPPLVSATAVPLVVTTASALPPVSQDLGIGGPPPPSGTVSSVAASPAPTVIIRQPEPVRPYTGPVSYTHLTLPTTPYV